MNTVFLLMAQYAGRPLISIEEVCRDFFTHLTAEKLVRKIHSGEIKLPLVKLEASQKSARGIHLNDLASYIDECRSKAKSEMEKLHRS